MDLWLIAATVATGYITKHLRNVSKTKERFLESSSEGFTSVKLESPRCLASELVSVEKPKEENFEDCVNVENLDLYECGNAYGVEVASSSEKYLGNNDEILSNSFKNRAFLRRNHRRLIKTFSVKSNVRSRLHREKMSAEEYTCSPFPSPCGSFLRPLVVTDGTQVISENAGDFISQQVPKCGIPWLRKLESSGLYSKRVVGNAKSVSKGSSDAVLLLCFGISIGIMSSFVMKQTEVNKVEAGLQQTENSEEKKDSTPVKEDLNQQCDEKTVENSESISNIEAELEAELERLEVNMYSSNIETDAFELEQEFEVDFAQGELRDDRVKRQRFDEIESNQEPSSNSTPESGNYTVSPRELSLRLHEVITSRYEKRIKELEIALQESQKKVEQLVMESEEKKKPLSRLREMKDKRDSNLPDSVAHITKEHNPREIQPLVMNLTGEAFDAFNESYEELMDINDYSEEDDVPYEMSLTSKSSPWSHKDDIKNSSRTSEDVNFFMLQDLLGLEEDEEEEEIENEMEKELIKQIVEKTKQGSSAVFNAQKMLFLMEETEQSL